jgi:hypothetical protein
MGSEKSLGDTCNADSECGEGLVCFDNFCAMGERKDDDDDDDEDSGDQPRFYFDLGAGLGLALVSNSTSTDVNPPLAVATDAANASQGMSGPEKLAAADEAAAAQGWNCDVAEVGTGQLSFSNCKTTVAAAGFVAVPILNATVGYFVTPRLALEGAVRYQLKHGEGSWGGLGIGLRTEIQLTEPAADGFHAGLLGGVLLGKVQAQAPAAAASKVKEGPYASSGLFGVQLGMRLGYQFTRSVGLVVTPIANIMFGNFLFALDLNAGLRFAF